MRIRTLAAGMTLIFAGLTTTGGAAERPKVVKESMTIESHMLFANKATRKLESRKQTVNVAVYRPNDGLKHPAIVYLHGGGWSFADPVMDRFHIELASRGLVVLAPHYLLDGTGWPHWHESAVNTVTLAASLPGVNPDHIGISGISMGGQIGLSTAARDPRIKAVAEYFTAWPGSLPNEPVDKLPPVLLLNGTADPIIPFGVALELDEILKEHKLPFERHVYEGLGHGFSTPATFKDGLNRTTAFFGGKVDEPGPTPTGVETTFMMDGQSEWMESFFDVSGEKGLLAWPTATENSFTIFLPKAKPKRLVVKKPGKSQASSISRNAAKP